MKELLIVFFTWSPFLWAQSLSPTGFAIVPNSTAGQEAAPKIETRLKLGNLDDFKKLEDTSRVDRKGFKNFFKNTESGPQVKLRVLQGPGTSGGGDILKCGRDKRKFFGQDEVATYYLADTYSLYKSGILDKRKVLPEAVWHEAIFTGLNQSSDGLGELVRKRLKQLRFVESDGPLADLPDDHISVAGTDCEKKQLAIQDLATGLVKVDFNLLGFLSYQELYYFKIHEALISLKKTQEDTTSIREELKTAVENVSLQDILSQVLKSYISVPYTSKMLWTLKLLESHQTELWIQPNCESKKIKDEKKCLLHLLSQSFNIPSISGAGRLISRETAKTFAGSGFINLPDKKSLLNQIEDHLTDVLDFTLALGAYVSPHVSVIRKDSVDFKKYEEIHLSLVNEIRYLQNQNSYRWIPGLIHWLNEDMERFRKEYYGRQESEAQFESYDTPRDRNELKFGECYLKSHNGTVMASNSFASINLNSTLFAREFFKCYFAQNQMKSLRKNNPQLSAEEILMIVGSALEKDFDSFSESFLNTFSIEF